MPRDYEAVLSFWLGELDELGRAPAGKAEKWWKKDESFDRAIRESFLDDYDAILAGDRSNWLETPRGRLATIIVLDQFARNMFRGTPRMYQADPLAQEATLDGIALRMDRTLWADERVFFYMPLMHAEDLGLQERSVALFTALRDEAPKRLRKRMASNLRFAVVHRDIVAEWGRFPHRNEILGRESTPEELEFLKRPGSSF